MCIVVYDESPRAVENGEPRESAVLDSGEMTNSRRAIVPKIAKWHDGNREMLREPPWVQRVNKTKSKLGPNLAGYVIRFSLEPPAQCSLLRPQSLIGRLDQLVERGSRLLREVGIAPQVGRDHGERLSLRNGVFRPDEVVRA